MLALKVLDSNMRSCNGGDQFWKLNKTYRCKGKLKLCSNGYHLTFLPKEWEGTRVFLAEIGGVGEVKRDKLVCRSVKLLKEMSKSELAVYDESIVTARKVYDESIATARKVYDESIAPARKVYYESIATARKVYYESTATAEKVYYESTATAEKVYYESIQKILQTFLPIINRQEMKP
jgi:hypothetical protein